MNSLYYLFFRAQFYKVWHSFKIYFFNYASTQNLSLEHVCDLLMEPLFKFVDKYTIILGRVS